MSKSTFSYEDAYGQAPVGSSPSSKQPGNISYEDAFGLEPAAPASRGIKGVAQDVAATAVKSALAVPEAAVGVADLVTGGRAGKALEGMGVRIKDAREIAEGWHSDTTKAQKQEFQNAEGVVDKAKVALANPSLIAMGVGESLGAMGAGGLVGRGLTAATRLGQMGAKGAALAGAAGEGVVGAGSAAEQIRQQTDDGLLTAKQTTLAAGTGVATGVLGAVGGKVALRLGIGDADTMMAQGMKGMAKDTASQAVADAVNPLVAQAAKKSILRQMGEGAISEGVLEELPQSVSEQILQNEALNKPWSEGLDDAIVMGILSGGAMGAGAAGFHGYKGKQLDDATRKAQEAQAAAVQSGTAQPSTPPAAQWTTSAGAADPRAQAGTAPASPANAPNLDYETLPGAAPGAMGNEIDFAREYPAPDWGTDLGAAAPVMTPSQAMGLDPNAGALSKAAVLAVDSGASPVVQQPAVPAAEHAPVPQQAVPQAPEGVDPDTGEISLQVQMDELKGRIAFMQQQGAAQGWNKEMVNQRNALQSQLTKLEVQSAKENKQGASTTGAPAPVKLTGITQILTKQIPDMSAGELQQAIAHYGPNHKRTKKLEKALQTLAQKPLVAIEIGVKTNGTETSQTQQGSPQPAQAGPAQASATAQQSAVTQSQKIAHEGNALREQQRQRLVDASERWTRMTGMERQALTEGLKTMNVLTRKNVHTRPWADLSDKVRGQLADAISAQNSPVAQENNTLAAIKNEANSALAKQEAQSMADAKPFAPETGTLGIPRADMPQVPTANHGGLVKHLNAQGIAHETKTVDAADLKPTQAEFSPSKVEAAKSATGDRAVIVSSDGHIIDGHHQAVAAAEEGKQVKAIVLDAPVEKALEAVKASPSANPSAPAPATEPAPAPKSVPQRMKEAKAAKEAQAALAPSPAARPKSIAAKAREAIAARAAYFMPGNIVKSYGGYDRVIAYTPPDDGGRWSVTVQAVHKQGSVWLDEPNEGQRTHATQPDKRELVAGPVERAQQQEAKSEQSSDVAPSPELAPASFLERHNAIEDGISAGTLVLEDYKSAFAELEANQDAVLAELSKLTKEKLLRAGGPAFTYRMKDDKKDAIVLAAYQKMLDTYSLGRSYGSSSYFLSASSIAKNKADKAQALREMVANTTAEDLAARAAEIKAARDEFKAQRDAAAEALANPKSLQDFRGFMRHWMDRGETMNQAYLRLSLEQRQQYDALEAAQSKDGREAAKRRAMVSVASAGDTTAGEVIATKHTKHGHDLFVVKLAERVERDAYDTLNSSAKRLGGSYSSYRGNGAVPGFQFRTREAAEAFQKLVGGDTAQAQELANQRRDAFDDDKSQSAAERLRTMAEALDERASEALGADRKVNTARRARFAASADAAARTQQALAGTMRNIAQAIDTGTTQFLDGVRQRAQVEYLMGQLRTAKSNQLQAKYPDYGERMKRQGEPMDSETMDFAAFPTYEMFRSDWASLARQLLALDGGKKLGATLARTADDVTEAYTDWAKENLLRVSHFGNKLQGGFAEFASKDDAERAIKRSGLAGKAVVLPIKRGQNRVILSPSEAMQQGLWQGDGDKRISIGAEFIEDLMKLGKRKGSKALALPWQLENAYENRQRLQRMGILTRAEFRSALRELVSLQQEMATPDRIKELERSMVGRANDGLDFFPTSPAVVQSMLDAAEIAEGMAVLEPSAGMGHIADAIVAESGVWPDVVELSGSRRELLEAKGFHLAEVNDFTQMEPRRFFTYGDTFRAPDGVEGTMRGVGGMGSQRVRLEDAEGNRLGLYDRGELVGVAQNGTWSGYDRIIMNPPFSDGRDIAHVLHAYNLLRPGGRIVAIMGEGAFFQSNKRAEAFRDWLDERGATNEKLPDGSFMDPSLPVNTGVAARMVVIDKPAGDMQLAPRTEDDEVHNFADRVQTSPLDTFPAEFMAELSAADELFAYPSVHAGSPDAALRQVDPSIKLVGDVTAADERSESGADTKLLFRTGNGRDLYVFEKGNEFWLDVSRLGEGDGGNRIYAALMDYAATNDRVFIGDPAGLSDIAMRRRLEAMISSAIKRGSTDHMEPHARQVAGDEALGVPALKWHAGDTIGNIQRMIDVSLASIDAHVPEFRRARYDFATAAFRNSKGAPISDDDLRGWASKSSRMRAAGVGLRTIKRGILLNSVLRAESSQRPGLLEQALRQQRQLVGEQAKGIFYKLGTGNERRPASAQDKAVMQAIAQGKSARDVLRVVASGSKDPFLRQVARMLLKAGITPNIEFGHIGKTKKGDPIHGQYRGRSDTIAIAGSAEYAAERIFMHEAMHAATMRALAKPGLAKLQLQKLAAHVRKQPGAAGFYGISDKNGNVDEFVAEVFTNPDFQAALRKINAPAGGTIKTAWDGFVRILRSILGLPNDSTNALSQALNLGVAAMREDMALRKDRASASLKLHGNTVAGAGVSAIQLRVKTAQWAKSRWSEGAGGQAEVVHNSDPRFDKDVRIAWQGVKHAIAGANQPELRLIPHVTSIMQAARYVRSEDDRAGRAHIKQAHFFEADVVLDGERLAVGLVVHEKADGQLFYDQFIVSKPRAQNGAPPHGTSGNGMPGISDRSVLQPSSGGSSIVAEDGRSGQGQDDVLNFGADDFASLKTSALDQLSKTFTHEGKVSLWDKTVGTMRNLAERAPAFKPVYEAASQNIDDVSMLANDAADMAPRILPRVETLSDLKKKPVSAEDNKAIAKPLFEGTLIWARDENGKAVLVDDLQKRYETLSVHNKAAMLLKHGKIDAGLLAMWQGLPVEQFEKLINSRFESKMLKPGIVWTDAELKSQFSATDNQISLYRESRAAIDRSIDVTARTDMLRVMGEDYAGLREVVLAQPSVESAAQLLLDTLQDDAKANPDAADRLGVYMQQIKNRMETAADLQAKGYAPLSRFGRYTVDVVDADGERQYFGMYESQRESNLAKMQLASEFKGATITQGTMSAEAYKLFAGVTPETLEQFGEMLGLKAEGNEAQDKAFQEFLKLTKNNHSAMKRLIHRKGMAGFSEDVGRVVANFVYSNARAGAMGLNAGKMDKAIGAIPKEQGELKDLAMGLRSYIRDPQEEGQAVRGMLFAQYLGGSIASAFVNTTQPFAVTLPWLSQYGGMKKAGAQLARALKDMATKGHQYEADLAKALQSAEDDGVVSPQEIHQLMAQARGAGMLRSGDGTKAGDLRAKLANKWEQGKVLWGQPFALAEQFNRRSTFIAGYRTAKEQGIANPGEFARNAVIETQFQYSKANKPRWARGAVGGTLFTFKTYSVSYLELMNRMWTQGGPEGKRAVGWALAMLLLMSGAGGVPFMEDAEDLIDGAGQLMGYNMSAKQWRKQAMADVVGKELAEFMEQGISGLPGAPVDVSGRLGMGNLLPGTGLFLTKPNRERDLMEMVGPAGDLVSRGFTGARKLLGGDVAGAALEVSPTAVRNLAKGADMAATGMYRDSKGYKVIDTTLAEAAMKAVGFQPKPVAEVQEANSFMLRTKSFYTQTSSEIKAQWADALFRKDEAAVQRVRERLADWNRDNPEQPIVVKMPDVWKKVREMGKDRSARIADTAPKALREQIREQVRSLG